MQEKAFKYPPGIYLLKPTGQRVLINSYSEGMDGECELCRVLIEMPPDAIVGREVFDVPFIDLEPIETL